MEIAPVAKPSVEARLAQRLRSLRTGRGFTLDMLAEQSGVSRSMISLIERAESSPTANVLDKLAGSLGVTLAALFDEPAGRSAAPLRPAGSCSTSSSPSAAIPTRHGSAPKLSSPARSRRSPHRHERTCMSLARP